MARIARENPSLRRPPFGPSEACNKLVVGESVGLCQWTVTTARSEKRQLQCAGEAGRTGPSAMSALKAAVDMPPKMLSGG